MMAAGFSHPERGSKGRAKRPAVPGAPKHGANRILRLLPIALLAAAATALGPNSLADAQGIGGLDTNSPVQIAADQIELQDKASRVNLTGDVVITQGDLTLRAPRTTIAYTNGNKLEIQRLDATGGVSVTRGNESASGAVAVYDFNKRLITMTGGVTLRRGSDTLHGGRLVIDLRTGLSSVDGSAGSRASGQKTGGRVTGTFTVPK